MNYEGYVIEVFHKENDKDVNTCEIKMKKGKIDKTEIHPSIGMFLERKRN